MPNYSARVNDHEYPITADALRLANFHGTGDRALHLLRDARAHAIEVIAVDRIAKTVELRVDGREFSVTLRDELDQQIDALGFAATETVVSKNALAPMPGLVLNVLVEAGETVTAGTPLLILEAMKMENVLKAEGDGTVGEIHVRQGQAVEKKQLLITVA